MIVQWSHLNSGTGYPWDWHSITIAFLELFLKRVPSKSEDSVGDLNPMGSGYKLKKITWMLIYINQVKIWMLGTRYIFFNLKIDKFKIYKHFQNKTIKLKIIFIHNSIHEKKSSTRFYLSYSNWRKIKFPIN